MSSNEASEKNIDISSKKGKTNLEISEKDSLTDELEEEEEFSEESSGKIVID